ncbi:MAG: DUF1292 domain-containing protein [Candidatus Ventricola sp.]
MAESFGEDELFDDEWVEICDIEGRRMSMRHLATMRLGEKTYILLDDGSEIERGEGMLMLVREDRTVDGALEYVVSNDEQEIERVMGRFAAHLFEMTMQEEMPELELPEAELTEACGCEHRPGEFCYCDDPAYLQ